MLNLQRLLVFIGFTVFAAPNVSGYLNLFLNQHEVMRLLGLSAELYYVRDGSVNEYALHFTVPVPANMHDISFTWQSLAGKPLPYNIHIESSDLTVLPRPTMNISRSGNVPVDVETFAIDMQCSGLKSGEVEVTITIEVTLNRATNNVTEVVLRRKKVCLLVEQIEKSVNVLDDPYSLEAMSAIAPTGLLTLIIGSVLALLLVVILISIAYCARSPTKRGGHSQPLRTSSFQRLQTHPSAPPCSIVFPPAPPSTLPRSERINERLPPPPSDANDLHIRRCKVRLSDLLQEGTFGKVYRGTYEGQNVLVKTVSQHANETQVALLLKEGTSLFAASHPGILGFLGISIDDLQTPFVLYAASKGTTNLKLFLHEPSSRALTTIQIVMMSYQLALALGHLHSHAVVHKDVAARNCVIDEHLQVKLTESSLARDLFPEDYSCLGDSENRPIKWLALETLQKKCFSEASDTWAFGVLMWELCTLARQPYQEIVNDDMEQFLSEGYRLAQPVNCPDELFAIMAYCWALLPLERPSFGQLQVCLQDFHSQLTRYI